MLFNPANSIDFNLSCSTMLVQSLQRKAEGAYNEAWSDIAPNMKVVVTLIKAILDFPDMLNKAATNLSPVQSWRITRVGEEAMASINNSILRAENDKTITFRLALSKAVGEVVKESMNWVSKCRIECNMSSEVRGLEPQSVGIFYRFERRTASFQKGRACYSVHGRFREFLGLIYEVDHIGNVFIRKPAIRYGPNPVVSRHTWI